MPTKLTRFQKDPNDLGRGPGFYYLRGGVSAPYKINRDGKRVKPKGYSNGPYYSKYSASVDRATAARGYVQHKTGTPPKVADKYAHVTDGNIIENMWPNNKKRKK
jgi:hypothetical protein